MVSWIAAIFCVAVIVGLLWFASPLWLELFNFVGDLLRGTATAAAEAS